MFCTSCTPRTSASCRRFRESGATVRETSATSFCMHVQVHGACGCRFLELGESNLRNSQAGACNEVTPLRPHLPTCRSQTAARPLPIEILERFEAQALSNRLLHVCADSDFGLPKEHFRAVEIAFTAPYLQTGRKCWHPEQGLGLSHIRYYVRYAM